MNWLKVLGGIGSIAAAPFTGGGSLSFLPAALAGAGVSTALSGAFDKSGSGGSPSSNAGLDPLLKTATDASTATRARGTALGAEGDHAMAPVLDYFKKLVGGDEGALLSATRPERTRVIDQYDTARKSISEFSPRGGGSNAAMATSQFKEAGDLANITAAARSHAADSLGTIGTQLTGLGLSADQLASADLTTVINALLTQKGFDVQQHAANMSALGGVGEGLGTLLGLFLTRNKAA